MGFFRVKTGKFTGHIGLDINRGGDLYIVNVSDSFIPYGDRFEPPWHRGISSLGNAWTVHHRQYSLRRGGLRVWRPRGRRWSSPNTILCGPFRPCAKRAEEVEGGRSYYGLVSIVRPDPRSWCAEATAEATNK